MRGPRSAAVLYGVVGLSLCLVTVSCSQEEPETVSTTYDYGDGGYSAYDSYYGAGDITFIDDLQSNTEVSDDLHQLRLVDVNGNETAPADYARGKNIVLVITRGNTNPICPYCSTQTSRLIANYEDFQSRNTEVIVVYPVEHNDDAERLNAFLEASKNRLDDPNQPVPFPVLLDVELKAVDHLGIRKDLSKPATYILDPAGKVHFAYVGADLDDRPSIKAMLAELDQLVAVASTESTE